MNPNTPPLITALLQPHRYPGQVQHVELVETHISWVLLAGELAYKIKKPVRLSFLDFSTLAQRRACCLDELRLNRRFAPDLYLDVIPIFGSPDNPQWRCDGEPIEYAVKMRRFDNAQRLDRVCVRGELRPEHLSDLAQSLANFHAAAATADASSRFGEPAGILALALDNLQAPAGAMTDPTQRSTLERFRAWTTAEFTHLSPLMQARKSQGRVRECHGDLHLGNLVLLDGRVRMFDCIEFNDALRWIDIASELAFTHMDLQHHGQPGLANWFLDQYLIHSGDYEAAVLLRFYAVYRALVRGKVESIRWAQQASLARSEDHKPPDFLALAERLTTPQAPALVITHGLAGCGKTTASNRLLLEDPAANTLRLRSDVERKRLYGLSALARSGSGIDEGIYAAQGHAQTYQRLHEVAGMLLRAGWRVVVDAAFLRRAERQAFSALAKDCGASFNILAPEVSAETLRERISLRQTAGQDASEATLAVLDKQLGWIEPLDAEERQQVLSLPLPRIGLSPA